MCIIKVYSLQSHCGFELFMKTYLLHLQIWKMTHFLMNSLLCNANTVCGRENALAVRVQVSTGNQICSRDHDWPVREILQVRLENH